MSIVIPALNAENGLGLALASLMEGLEAGVIREVVVSDGGSTDATCAMADEAGAQVVTGPAGRGGQMRRGAAVAAGEWLLFLHADTELSEGWSAVVQTHMATEQRAGYFKLQFDVNGLAPKLVEGWANLRARWFGLPYGDQGLLISRKLYDEIGGYDDIDLMEDVAMARKLKHQLCALPATAKTSAARYQRAGWIRQSARNLWRLIRYLAGADPAKLRGGYEL